MPLEKTINGTDLILTLSDDQKATYKPVAASKGHSLEISADVIEASSQRSGKWKRFLGGRKEWSGSVPALFTYGSEDHEPLDMAALVGTTVNLKGQMVTDATLDVLVPVGTSVMWEGDAVITGASLQAEEESVATWNLTFKGDGPCEFSAVVAA